MSDLADKKLTRRSLLKAGAGAALAGGGALAWARGASSAGLSSSTASRAGATTRTIHLAGTDGWVGFPLPDSASLSGLIPDGYAPSPLTTYIFGFRDVTNLSPADILAQKNHAQAAAPLLYIDENDSVTINLTNLGFSQRPDIVDAHTIHFHGFRNAAPIFDGVPEMSISVPLGRTFPYFYNPLDPGTYIYHCHWDDVEHVQMGMTGIVFVRPAQNGQSKTYSGDGKSYTKFVYNDGDGSTGYDREWAFLLTEWWAQSHWDDAHIQDNQWTDFVPDINMLNGRTYPDTLAPNGGYDASGNPLPTTPDRLAYQPLSSVVRGNPGDTILLRFGHLGYQEHSMQLPGIPMRIVGKDATLLRGRDGTDLSFHTNNVDIGPGESVDAIITLPPFSGGTGSDSYGAYDAYPLFDRDFSYGYLIQGSNEHTGMRTEVRVYAPGTIPTQTEPNTP
jgi:FtsP/CotA-like multicopper oxidase with cupredoxin domain